MGKDFQDWFKWLQSMTFRKTKKFSDEELGLAAPVLSSGTIDSWTLLQVLKRKQVAK